MLGAVLILVALVALVPLFWLGGGIAGAVIGQLLKRNAESTHEGSPYIELNH